MYLPAWCVDRPSASCHGCQQYPGQPVEQQLFRFYFVFCTLLVLLSQVESCVCVVCLGLCRVVVSYRSQIRCALTSTRYEEQPQHMKKIKQADSSVSVLYQGFFLCSKGPTYLLHGQITLQQKLTEEQQEQKQDNLCYVILCFYSDYSRNLYIIIQFISFISIPKIPNNDQNT